MEEDVIEIEISENGQFKISTDQISAANHQSAEGLIKTIGRMAGGDMEAKPNPKKRHKHQHQEKLKVRSR